MSEIQHDVPKRRIAEVRRFNRFHTRLVGALNNRLLESEYPLPQLRVLYEVANGSYSASDLAQDLAMDPGYLSRLISGLSKDGLIEKKPSRRDARKRVLGLTVAGRDVFNTLDATSAAEVGELLKPLSAREQEALVGAMTRIRRLLGDPPSDRTFVLRDPEPGDLGWVVHRQSVLYTKEFGWDWTFEGLVAEIVSNYVRDFIPDKEKCWIAEQDGEIIGSVFVVRQDDDTAKLRMLYVEAQARGLGLGRRLVEECIRFARKKGYKRLELWTNDILIPACRIYAAAGFELLEEEAYHGFGHDLVGQTWSLDL
jgi:DNA-binding MarR family transcriptional regulator/GNAT superfamily N-acetyltransferase